MKVAIATESFPPHFDGVAKSVLHTADELHNAGHDVHVIAPAPHRGHAISTYPWPVTYVPSVPLPRYRAFRAGIPNAQLRHCLARDVDVLHLASPIGYTATAAAIAGQHHIPTVAIWQTDLPAWMSAYHMSAASRLLWRRLRRVHNRAALTLAPTSHARQRLQNNGIDNVHLWPRGVNLTQFHPRHYDHVLKESLCPNGELLVGYIGRLAREKNVHLLEHVSQLPGVTLVIAGDGPQRARLEKTLPGAHFLGKLTGRDLSALYATIDVFAHTGGKETFGQTLQEAHASATPVITVNSGGAADLVRDGIDGRLVADNSASAFAEAVTGMVNQSNQLRHWGLKGRYKVETRSWKSLTDDLLGHYRKAITATAAPHQVN